MSFTVRNCLALPCFSSAKLVAGYRGLDNIVKAISVVEFDDLDDDLYVYNEMVLASFYSVKDSVDDQCKVLEHCRNTGVVAVVLYYSDIIMKGVDARLLDTAGRLDLPLIIMPESNWTLNYSEVISEVMEQVVLDKHATANIEDNVTLARKIYPLEDSFNFWQLSLAEKCRTLLISQNHRELTTYRDMIHPIKENGENLLNILSVYLIDSDSRLNRTAELTFLHRNTVIYQLNKAKDLVGGDFTCMPFKYEMYFALALERASS